MGKHEIGWMKGRYVGLMLGLVFLMALLQIVVQELPHRRLSFELQALPAADPVVLEQSQGQSCQCQEETVQDERDVQAVQAVLVTCLVQEEG